LLRDFSLRFACENGQNDSTTFFLVEGFTSIRPGPTQHGLSLKCGGIMKGKHGKWMGKISVATAVLGGVMLFAGAGGARADEWNRDYDRQVRYTEWRAHEAAERFGYNSREARHWRHENHEARERERHARHEYREHAGRDRY
jgi:hypothetical protein